MYQFHSYLLGFIPPNQWKNPIYGTTDALFFFLYIFHFHAQEGGKMCCSFLFYYYYYFFNHVLDLFDTGMHTPIISQSVHPSE